MSGYVDLHCHWLPTIDDGARSVEDGLAMLRGLKQLGFSSVVATPHMRPGMFDNDAEALRAAFEAMGNHVRAASEMPDVHLASEHFFDDVVFQRLMKGEGLPYPNAVFVPEREAQSEKAKKRARRGVLLEWSPQIFPPRLDRAFFELAKVGLRPVVAHPERYQPVWRDDRCLDALLDAGACLLLDVCALVGKYGRASQKAAEKLLDDDAYEAACSDSHRPDDVAVVAEAIHVLEKRVGAAEVERLFRTGPLGILNGG